jgi:hypothetical protein
LLTRLRFGLRQSSAAFGRPPSCQPPSGKYPRHEYRTDASPPTRVCSGREGRGLSRRSTAKADEGELINSRVREALINRFMGRENCSNRNYILAYGEAHA